MVPEANLEIFDTLWRYRLYPSKISRQRARMPNPSERRAEGTPKSKRCLTGSEKISSLPHQVDTELLHDPFYKFEPYNAADTGRYKNGVIGRMKRPEME